MQRHEVLEDGSKFTRPWDECRCICAPPLLGGGARKGGNMYMCMYHVTTRSPLAAKCGQGLAN